MTSDAARRKSFQEQLELMQQAYAARLPDKIDQIEENWEALCRQPADAERGSALRHMVHSLAGSGRTFGLPAVTEAARMLENLIVSVVPPSSAGGNGAAGAPTISESQSAQFTALLKVLRQAGARSGQELFSSSAGGYLPSELRNEFLWPPEAAAWPTNEHYLILLLGAGRQEARVECETPDSEAPGLVAQLECFGYQVTVCRSVAALQEKLEQTLPSVILVQTAAEQWEALAQMLQPLQNGRDAPLPVIFISDRDDLEMRLRAVRAGGIEFFVEPLDVSVLSGKLHTLTARRTPSALRVLIVEDDPALSRLYAFILQQAGMTVRVARDSREVLPSLHEETPDAILMDVQLPACSGLELACAIRQMDAFTGVPIIFLSADAELPAQRTQMHLGGDLFLAQPVHPERLMAATSAAAQRSRVLRSFMVRDSLTGLLNHTQIKEQLDVELARALRANTTLSLALLDLDKFQQINEEYGHAQGDRVLKSMTRLLRQLVRRTDALGRYDGDAFVVILPEAGRDDAERVLDRVRHRFANLVHCAQQAQFCVTFSCGIANVPPPDHTERFVLANELLRSADGMLQQAKREGGNCIRLVTAPRA